MAATKVRLGRLRKVQAKTGSQRRETNDEKSFKQQDTVSSTREAIEKIQNCITTKDKSGQKSKSETATFRVILALISALIYANSLNAGFVYDDRRAILGNRNVQAPWSQLSGWSRLLTDDFWGTPLSHSGSHKSYRPLVTLTFKLQELASRLFSNNELCPPHQQPAFLKSASSFHLFNLLLHLLVVDQVFQLSLALFGSASGFLCKLAGEFRDNAGQVTGGPPEEARLEAPVCIAGLLFACHPIHVEAVSSLVGRAELMGALFALLSFRRLASYLAGAEPGTRRNLWLSVVFASLACLSKENSAVAVILINVLMVVWHALRWPPVAGARHKRSQSGAGVEPDFLGPASQAGLAMLSVALALVALRIQLGGAGNQLLAARFSYLDNPLAQSGRQLCLHEQSRRLAAGAQLNTSTSHQHTRRPDPCSSQQFIDEVEQWRLMTRFYIPTFAVALLAWPSELSYDWPLEAIGGLITSPLERRFLASLGLYLVLCVVTLRYLYQVWVRNCAASGWVRKRQPLAIKQGPSRDVASARGANDHGPQPDTARRPIRSPDTNMSAAGFLAADHRPTHFESLTCAANQEHKIEQADNSGGPRITEPNDVLAWSLAWSLLPYLSASNLLLPVGFLVAERTLYLPSVGFCMLVAHLVDRLSIGACWRCLLWLANLGSKLARLLALADAAASGPAPPQNMWRQPTRNSLARGQKFKGPAVGWGAGRGFDWFGLRWWLAVAGADDRTTKLALIFPLLMLGSIKTAHRSSQWHDERSLFSSNLKQAPAKSMGNLASLPGPGPPPEAGGLNWAPHTDEASREALYREALRREPQSAELHYNLALLLQRRLRGLPAHQQPTSSKPSHNSAREAKVSVASEIEYHYELALELRPNFPLAALNLAAYQYGHQNQLEAAWRSYTSCAFEMAPQGTRTFRRHVGAQIECLISGARMRLQQSRWTNRSARDAAKQTTSAGCRLVRTWMHAALQRATTLLDASTSAAHDHDYDDAIHTDLNKQLSSIYWLMAQCREPATATTTATTMGTLGTGSMPRATHCHELKESVGFGLRSQVSVEASVYTDYADCLLAVGGGASSNKEGAEQEEAARLVLRQALKSESDKTSRAPGELARLHQRLARLLGPREALQEMHRALAELGGAGSAEHRMQLANYLAQTGQLAYKLGRLADSDQLYRKALDTSREVLELDRASDTRRRLLSSAHVNYGAIAEVQGRRQEAQQMYRQALVVEPGNKLARANLRRLAGV